MKGGLCKCRIKATGKVKHMRCYEFGYVCADGQFYHRAHVVRIGVIKE